MATAEVEVQDTGEENELDSALEASQKAGDVDDSTGDSKDEKSDADADAKDEDKDKDKDADADDKGDKDAKGDSDKDKDPVAERLAELEDQNKEMKQLLRASQRQSMIDRSKFDRIAKRSVQTAGDVLDDDSGDKDKEDKLSAVEQLQSTLSHIAETREDIMELQLDSMEMREATNDVREVCSKTNFDDVFEVIAKHQTAEKGGAFEENLLRVELEVWSMKNPYKYMYGVIKEYHPTYAESDKDSKAGDSDPAAVLKKADKDKADAAVKKKAEEAKAPGSIANLGGSDSDSSGGWTAERIDKLSEDELDSVPEKVYTLYLRNELK